MSKSIRVEAEMMKHEDLRDELEKANNRFNEYIAKKIEENWTEKVRMTHEAPRSGDNEQVPPMDIDGNEIIPGERSSSEPACCMREPIGECPPRGYDTHTVGRPNRARREGAGKRDG